MVMAARRWCGSGGVVMGWRRWHRFGEGDNEVGVERDEVVVRRRLLECGSHGKGGNDDVVVVVGWMRRRRKGSRGDDVGVGGSEVMATSSYSTGILLSMVDGTMPLKEPNSAEVRLLSTRFHALAIITSFALTSAEGDLRKFSDIGAWYAIEDCASMNKNVSYPQSAIFDETIANPNAQIVRDDMVRVQIPRCMAWLDYDEHVDYLSTIDNEVGVTSPESTTQTLTRSL
ncbi:hypothetical protein Tco_0227009 [Tanacetum coccineum]